MIPEDPGRAAISRLATTIAREPIQLSLPQDVPLLDHHQVDTGYIPETSSNGGSGTTECGLVKMETVLQRSNNS